MAGSASDDRPGSDPPRTVARNTPGRWLGELCLLLVVGICGLAAWTLYDLRQNAWTRAQETSLNLLRVLESDIARNIELYDLSLEAVISGLAQPGFADLSPDLKQAVLFDSSTRARFLGAVLAIDRDGNVTHDSLSKAPRSGNFADRDYFAFHRDRRDAGVYVSKPYRSSRTGEWTVGVSRRLDAPDGSFDGIVMGSLRLTYLRELFGHLNVGPGGSVNLFLLDGTALMRQPYSEGAVGRSIAAGEPYRRMSAGRSGTFVARSVLDQVERLYTFTRVGELPLILDVALGVDDILAEWRLKSISIGLAVLALCAVAIGLTFALWREFKHRANVENKLRVLNAELTELAVTDPLTQLYNRRRFDDMMSREWRRAQRNGQPVGLLMLDVDNFKSFNDNYGHGAGDEVLKQVADILRKGVRNPVDVPCRMGGEEFAVILPETDAASTLLLAERLRRRLEEAAIPHRGSARGVLTTSIGVIACRPKAGGEVAAFIRAADEALYGAKAGGRNRVQAAPATLPTNGRRDQAA